MGIIRAKKDKNNTYIKMAEDAFEDENLSFKAKGILGYLMSKPDNWRCQVKDLMKHAKDGNDSIKAGLRELREHGYITKEIMRNDNGAISHWDETIFETPQEHAKELFKKQENRRKISQAKKKIALKGKSRKGINPFIVNTKSTTNEISCSKPTLKTADRSVMKTNEEIELVEEFEDNICKLGKSTLKKLINYYREKRVSLGLLKTILGYCSDRGAKAFTYFQKVLESCLENGITTTQAFKQAIKNFYYEKTKIIEGKKEARKRAKKKQGANTLKFNDFDQRTYDYDKLERQLLGWE